MQESWLILLGDETSVESSEQERRYFRVEGGIWDQIKSITKNEQDHPVETSAKSYFVKIKDLYGGPITALRGDEDCDKK